MEKILSIKNLTFSYKNKKVFDNVSFDINNNTINCILGSNNCGKTTLIKLLTGVLDSKNCIIYDNKVINKKNVKEYMLNMGCCFYQNKNVFLFDDVYSEIVFPLENLSCNKEFIKKRVNEVKRIFDLKSIIKKNVSELTEFERVKVIISSIMIYNPRIVFLDSIFDNLSYDEYSYFIDILEQFNTSIVYTTSNVMNTLEADRVIVIDSNESGNILYDDDPYSVLEHSNVLSKLGLEIPTMIDISLMLKFYNVLDHVVLSPERLVNELWN